MAEIIPINSGELMIAPGTVVTEDQAALEFAQKFGGRLAYCHDHGRWFEYDGNIWSICRTPIAFHYARELARRISLTALQGAQLQKTKFAAGVEQFCRADPIFARTSDFWDRDIWLLGTPSGTVDLRTGRLRPPMQSDNITKSTAVSPDEEEYCPTWTRFLDQATAGDVDLQRFLQQIAGMALTGDISEQALFFIYGDGGRGKGTFVNTLQKVMGDYAITASMDTFAATRHAKHETELARLRGARLVTSSETESGTAWAESRIKQLTGGDIIAARFMRQDFFEFLPQFTLVIMGNFKPSLRTVDEAMKRRFNIIPFDTAPPEKDLHLSEKLEAEWPSILRWAIKGCLDWRQNGLIRPPVVLAATEEYFEEQNSLQQWMEQECNIQIGNPYVREKTMPLFNSWTKFAKASGFEPGDSKSFKTSMERCGIKYKPMRDGRYFLFISLKSADGDLADESPEN